MFVRILDHHDRGIDHRADGNGDTTEAHQVGVHAEQAHRNEGDQYTDW